jgi:hypothetical protein
MLKDATVLLVRHGEKPGSKGIDSIEDGPELSQPGRERAHAYVAFFQPYTATEAGKGKAQTTVVPDGLFAAKDTDVSHRPRLTLEPLARDMGLKLNHDYKDDDLKGICEALKASPARKIVVCWHHGKIIELADMLIGRSGPWPSSWPPTVFGWTIQIRYDIKGQPWADWIKYSNQKLMFDDTINTASAASEPTGSTGSGRAPTG